MELPLPEIQKTTWLEVGGRIGNLDVANNLSKGFRNLTAHQARMRLPCVYPCIEGNSCDPGNLFNSNSGVSVTIMTQLPIPYSLLFFPPELLLEISVSIKLYFIFYLFLILYAVFWA